MHAIKIQEQITVYLLSQIDVASRPTAHVHCPCPASYTGINKKRDQSSIHFVSA